MLALIPLCWGKTASIVEDLNLSRINTFPKLNELISNQSQWQLVTIFQYCQPQKVNIMPKIKYKVEKQGSKLYVNSQFRKNPEATKKLQLIIKNNMTHNNSSLASS